MITISQIRAALVCKDYSALRVLHAAAKGGGIELCDEEMLATVSLRLIEVALMRGDATYERQLTVMLDAIERGNHPYDDIITSSFLDADAAIAQAQIDAIVGRQK